MGGFEQKNWLEKPETVQEAIKRGDSEALSRLGKAGANKREQLRDGDRLYDAHLKEKEQEEWADHLKSTNEHTHPID